VIRLARYFMTKKILYIITKSNWGGAQRYVYELATSLPKNSFDAAVLMGGSGSLKERLDLCGIRTITIPELEKEVNIFKDIKTFFALIALLNKEKPDIIHLNSSKAGILGALAGRVVGIRKIIFTAHGWGFTEDRPLIERLFIRYFQWLSVFLSHQTIAVSFKTKKEMGGLLFAGRKITVIYNGIERPVFKTRESARKEIANEHKVPQKTFWVGTIAELHRNKGLKYAIEAFSLLNKSTQKKLSYLVIGDGEEKQFLENLIDRHNLKEKIFLLGYKKDAALYLSAFDCFLFPSIKEGFPYAVLEAGMAKLPVLASSVGGIPEIIEQEKTGILVQPRSSSAITQSLQVLVESANLRKRYENNLHEIVSAQYTKGKMVQATKAVYEMP